MALPKINTPTYKTEIPSTKTKIEFRPFLVGEQKILYIALESEDNTQIAAAIKTILEKCVLTPIKVDDLTTFDMEFLFLKLRAKSVGETVEVKFEIEDCTCEKKTTAEVIVNLDKIPLTYPEGHEKLIKLTDNITVEMKYPTADLMAHMTEGNDLDNILTLIGSCIAQVIDGEAAYAEFTQEEASVFLESLSRSQLQNLSKFFETMPHLEVEIQGSCKTCGAKGIHKIEGLHNFFG